MLAAIAFRFASYRDFDPSGKDGQFLTIVDEIHITEQLCNLMYGIRLICASHILRAGEWDWWTTSRWTPTPKLRGVHKRHFDDAARSKFGEADKAAVMSKEFALQSTNMIATLMKEARGVDFRLPYMRIWDLRAPEVGNNMADEWYARRDQLGRWHVHDAAAPARLRQNDPLIRLRVCGLEG